IHTENSQKYTIPHIRSMAADADLRIQRLWHDPAKKFSVTLLSE
ncbi:MAG: L-histidine N(alpha)-methyltransferase, partial [Cenarchaeum sp. SB0677_bin_16]|nr:L-histidine N(alpha)-methyltransferase [Cenarchaeum sp. SB0677_bin_16]